MVMTIRTGMLGLLGLCGLWGCGGTATHGDSDASDTDASDSTNGTDGDGSGDFGSGNGSGGNSTGGVGGNDSTGSDGSGTAATTRGSGSRNNSASSTTSGSTTGSSTASASSGGGPSTGFTASTGVGTVGFGGAPVNTTSTFGSTVVTTVSTAGSVTVGSVSTTSGASTTGAGSPPELDEFPYLDDCDASYWYFSGQYCNLGFNCPATSGWVSCWDVGNGNISCDCGREYSWGNYQLSDGSTTDACAYAASACVAGPDAEQGKTKCTPSSFYQSTNYCNATANCETKVKVEGADMVKAGWRYAYCYAETDGWACDCEFDDGRMTVSLDTSTGSADMCVDAIDWCSGDITREGPRDCSPFSQYASTNSCYVNLRCTQAAVAGGIPASITENYTLSCGQASDGKWVCDCPGVGNFDVEADTGWDACTLGAAECAPT